MISWKTLATKTVAQNPWFSLRQDKVQTHTGKQLTYNVVDIAHPYVCIVPLNAHNEVLLERIYRYPSNQTMWELPAGHSDGEHLLAAAKRELLEETGLTSESWHELGTVYAATGIANCKGVYFLAQDVSENHEPQDKEEPIIERRFMSLEAIDRLVITGELTDTDTLSALYMLRLYLSANSK